MIKLLVGMQTIVCDDYFFVRRQMGREKTRQGVMSTSVEAGRVAMILEAGVERVEEKTIKARRLVQNFQVQRYTLQEGGTQHSRLFCRSKDNK